MAELDLFSEDLVSSLRSQIDSNSVDGLQNFVFFVASILLLFEESFRQVENLSSLLVKEKIMSLIEALANWKLRISKVLDATDPDKHMQSKYPINLGRTKLQTNENFATIYNNITSQQEIPLPPTPLEPTNRSSLSALDEPVLHTRFNDEKSAIGNIPQQLCINLDEEQEDHCVHEHEDPSATVLPSQFLPNIIQKTDQSLCTNEDFVSNNKPHLSEISVNIQESSNSTGATILDDNKITIQQSVSPVKRFVVRKRSETNTTNKEESKNADPISLNKVSPNTVIDLSQDDELDEQYTSSSVKIFDSLKICFYGRLSKPNPQISEAISKQGGFLEGKLCDDTSFVITTRNNFHSEKTEKSKLMTLVKEKQIPVVDERYIYDCIEKKQLLDRTSYLFSNYEAKASDSDTNSDTDSDSDSSGSDTDTSGCDSDSSSESENDEDEENTSTANNDSKHPIQPISSTVSDKESFIRRIKDRSYYSTKFLTSASSDKIRFYSTVRSKSKTITSPSLIKDTDELLLVIACIRNLYFCWIASRKQGVDQTPKRRLFNFNSFQDVVPISSSETKLVDELIQKIVDEKGQSDAEQNSATKDDTEFIKDTDMKQTTSTKLGSGVENSTQTASLQITSHNSNDVEEDIEMVENKEVVQKEVGMNTNAKQAADSSTGEFLVRTIRNRSYYTTPALKQASIEGKLEFLSSITASSKIIRTPALFKNSDELLLAIGCLYEQERRRYIYWTADRRKGSSQQLKSCELNCQTIEDTCEIPTSDQKLVEELLLKILEKKIRGRGKNLVHNQIQGVKSSSDVESAAKSLVSIESENSEHPTSSENSNHSLVTQNQSTSVVLKPNSDTREKPTPKKQEVEEEEEIVHCVCKSKMEKGLMLECDKCKCWAHALCLGIMNERDIPKEYICLYCQREITDSQREMDKLDPLEDSLALLQNLQADETLAETVSSRPLVSDKLSNIFKETDCGICFLDLKDGQEIFSLHQCSHTFHLECIDRCLQSRAIRNKRCCKCFAEINSEEEKKIHQLANEQRKEMRQAKRRKRTEQNTTNQCNEDGEDGDGQEEEQISLGESEECKRRKISVETNEPLAPAHEQPINQNPFYLSVYLSDVEIFTVL